VGVLCLIMVKVFVFDPDYLRRQVAPRIDYLGLGLLILGIGALQIMLDKGEREDWFSSVFIVRLALISAVALIILVYWELKTRQPFVNLRLFKDHNYSVGLLIFFFFRFVLYGSMVLLPLFLQLVMGYDATLAGMAMAWGGVSAFLIMPVVGRLTSRVDNRLLAIVGLAIGALATYLLSLYNTQIDFATAAWPRFIQGLGAGIAFVSLTNLTMGHLPREIMGDATGIYNLLRNLGGSSGIAVATTFLSRRSQFHQVRLVEHLTPFSLPFNEWRQHIVQIIPGLTPRTELWQMPHALAVLYQQMQAQSQTLAFADVYWLFTLLFLILIPLVLFMRHHWTVT
jgi:DHA2 family multidrug resistance protein